MTNSWDDSDKPVEECAVAGVIGGDEAAHHVYLALYALQHRGQEGSGIATFSDDGAFHLLKQFGLVRDVFSEDSLEELPGSVAIGHNRYPTCGGRSRENLQPFTFRTSFGRFALATNGQLTNAATWRERLEAEGSIFQSTSDTEVFMHLLARTQGTTMPERIREVMQQLKGAYALLIMMPDRLYAIRDPFGLRPLVWGKKGTTHVVASETCALDLMDAAFERDVAPGEILEITRAGSVTSYPDRAPRKASFCAFEPIYFSRPDSMYFDESVYELRRRMGTVLARETHLDADFVIPVPDSGLALAVGYAHEAEIPLELGLIRNHYVGRTFIEPTQSIRDFSVKLKLNPISSILKGKRVVVIDDSLVRGTTSVKIIRMLREAGARTIHMRIGSPPITHSCYFGVDTPNRLDLLAAQKSIDEMRALIGVDSLAFLSLNGLKKALGEDEKRGYCTGCFSGFYPEDIGVAIAPQPTDWSGGPGLQSASFQ